ncbi:ERF superfamily protein [Cupriavidus metallidurans]|uniref:ERF family protein n=1 Tax=Cupriavidus metallidurans TaxID=119219 RepID=UPI0004934BAA|nr:ERF family protein [Cupriavidus metallidurans]MDE4918590.1 ERF family protein [Cupriavidus metallidurans]
MNTAVVEDIVDVEAAPSTPRTAALPAHRPTGALAATTPADLLRIAVESGADLDRLEKLMELQERWESKIAKKAYDAAFAAFKAEAVTIIKNKTVTDGPLRGKGYAELHEVVNAVTPALSRHGLSSSWRLTKDDKDWLEVTCYLRHVDGHEESVSMGGPPDTGGAKNAIQARASTKSYLERYTLKAITGLSEQADDDDGNGGAPQQRQQQGQRQQQETPAFYPQERFDANKAAWRDMVKGGRKTPPQMIAFIESRGAPLTDAQKNTIDSWSHEE